MENPEQVFRGLETTDPKIKFSKNTISFFPNYLNYSFITTFIPVIIFLPIYLSSDHKDDFWVDKTNLYFLIIVISFPLLLIMELKYYNTVIIDFDERIISVIPNLILKPIKRKRVFSFTEITRFEPMSIVGLTGLRIRYRAFTIGLVLKNSDKIKLLSMDRYNIAMEIAERLSSIVSSNKTQKENN
jgi:hypothetical protein